jgi:hypothetical protein
LGVSCASSAACTVVGESGDQLLAERWDGSNWAVQNVPTPAPYSSALSGVSCPSLSWCTAVGSFASSGDPNTAANVAVAAGWNGGGWTLQRVLAPVGAAGVGFNAVSCTSATACIGVGFTQGRNHLNGAYETMAERWNGSAWTQIDGPVPPKGELTGVSCTSASDCIAVGWIMNPVTGVNTTLAEHWNGLTWTIQRTPEFADDPAGAFGAVSCHSTTACTAVGGHNGQPLVERWNGSSWTIQATPTLTNVMGVFASGVSCATPSRCTLAGWYATLSGAFTLAEGYF